MITAAAAKAVSNSFDSAEAFSLISTQIDLSALAGYFNCALSFRPEMATIVPDIELLGYVVTTGPSIITVDWSAA